MKRLLITAICAAMALPTVTPAQDYGHAARPPFYQHGGGQRYDRNSGGQGHHNGVGSYHDNGVRHPYYYGGPAYYYGGYQPYYYGNGYPYHYGHDHYYGNDDALWAIGGLVLGAIIGGAVEHANEHPPATASAPPPPAGQQEKYCDRVEYDSAGNPYVERSCDR